MYNQALKLNQALVRKEGMAIQYGSLGIVYATRGELDRAEEMFSKALKLNQALGSKKGMAIQYGNLGSVFFTRGDLERAEEMYNKALELFRQVGAKPQIKQTKQNLAELGAMRKAHSSD